MAADLAERGFGALARRHLLARGISRDQVGGWLRRGLLHPRYPGTYAWGRAELGTQGELAAALLYAGDGAALGSLTALWWQGLLGRRPALIHVDAPGKKRSHTDIAIRHPRRIERHVHRGLPVVSLPDALLAASRHLTRDSLRLVLARAEFKRLLSLQELEGALGRGRTGTRGLRAAIDAHMPQLARCENGLERSFVLLCEAERIEIPEPNVRIGRYRPDMFWRHARLVVELDGDAAHSTPAQLTADRERQAWLESRGLGVLRFRRLEVKCERGRVAAEVRGALAARAGLAS
ncbi:MAG TPA: DUF559 domain-containing protein [Solirubrobacterales bacterium]|nr:DUF559 domain-containing protein [Solirubrobacterales bacterium]